MVSARDKSIYFQKSFNEQMSLIDEEVEYILKGKNQKINHGITMIDRKKGAYHAVERMFGIIKEDPKNIAVLREVEAAEKELWAFLENKPGAKSEEEIYTYWNNYLWAYVEELESGYIHYLLIRGYDDFHDGDEWIGIYDNPVQLKSAYRAAVQELEQEHKQYGENGWTTRHEKVVIHAYDEAAGKWHYNIPYEVLFPEKNARYCLDEESIIRIEQDFGEKIMKDFVVKKDITFGELRCYLSRIDRLSICIKETMCYENFISLRDVPESYDGYFVYGIGMIESEFYKIGKGKYAVSGECKDLVLLKCIEVMLVTEPKSALIKHEDEEED